MKDIAREGGREGGQLSQNLALLWSSCISYVTCFYTVWLKHMLSLSTIIAVFLLEDGRNLWQFPDALVDVWPYSLAEDTVPSYIFCNSLSHQYYCSSGKQRRIEW